MLTRLRVNNFKNLVDVDVRFGPFTCIAGRNGVGKSNLFDAIRLLSDITEMSLLEAITGIRGETRSADSLRVFSRWPGRVADEMTLEAEMIVPPCVQDDLGQAAKATITFLRYSVTIRARGESGTSIPSLEVAQERLDYLTKGSAGDALPFAKGKREWIDSVLHGRRTGPYISTKADASGTFIQVHEDSGHQGRARKVKAQGLGRTLLSTLDTAESPTAFVARREMQSWRLLQLEPAHLRMPDDMKARPELGPDGQGLAAVLNRLLRSNGDGRSEAIRADLTNRLGALIDDVADVRVDRDEKRELLTLMARSREGVEFRARDLSDGTLRFLALAVLEADPTWGGLLCLEEPENGIHPTRIPVMLRLLQDLAVDLDGAVDEENPLRQVIVNTHSPEVVGLVPDDCMVFAETEPMVEQGTGRSLRLRPLDGTWRAGEQRTVSKGTVLELLNALPVALREAEENGIDEAGARRRPSVAARNDLQQLMLFPILSPGLSA